MAVSALNFFIYWIKYSYHPRFPYIGANPILVLYKYSMAPEWSMMVGDRRASEDITCMAVSALNFFIYWIKYSYHPRFPYIGANPILVLYKYSMAPEWSMMVGDRRASEDDTCMAVSALNFFIYWIKYSYHPRFPYIGANPILVLYKYSMAPEWSMMVGDRRASEDDTCMAVSALNFFIYWIKYSYHPRFPYIGANPILVLYKYSMAPEWSMMVGDRRASEDDTCMAVSALNFSYILDKILLSPPLPLYRGKSQYSYSTSTLWRQSGR